MVYFNERMLSYKVSNQTNHSTNYMKSLSKRTNFAFIILLTFQSKLYPLKGSWSASNLLFGKNLFKWVASAFYYFLHIILNSWGHKKFRNMQCIHMLDIGWRVLVLVFGLKVMSFKWKARVKVAQKIWNYLSPSLRDVFSLTWLIVVVLKIIGQILGNDSRTDFPFFKYGIENCFMDWLETIFHTVIGFCNAL